MFAIVDTNEQSTNPKVVDSLRAIFPKLQVSPLAFGDLNIILDDGSILAIERKRASDFLGSIADGRVFRQVQAMSDGAKWSCILIEGRIEFSPLTGNAVVNGEETNWRGSSVRGAMLAIMWAGCPIIQTNHYADTIMEIVRFCSKPDKHHQTLGQHRIVSFPPVELKEEIIAAFPGIGLTLSRSLFEFAGEQNGGISTLAEALCWASNFPKIDKKSRPKGWGDKTVINFRGALGHKDGEYLSMEIQKDKDSKKGKKNVTKK